MSSLEAPLWWDRDIDRTGRKIRLDVREAALNVWQGPSFRIQFIVSDPSQAADLMEKTVAQLSRYLDRKEIALFSRKIEGLVAYSFQRAVKREFLKRSRMLPLDESGALSKSAADETWQRKVQARLELLELIGLLTEKSRSVLALRYAGYTWKETAQVMDESIPSLRSAFWRDVNRVKRDFAEQSRHDDREQPNFRSRQDGMSAS